MMINQLSLMTPDNFVLCAIVSSPDQFTRYGQYKQLDSLGIQTARKRSRYRSGDAGRASIINAAAEIRGGEPILIVASTAIPAAVAFRPAVLDKRRVISLGDSPEFLRGFAVQFPATATK
ncbi:MAG: hypothetical protein WC992_05930 [Acholeplasmataceae bacterium]|jgi:hypothetical protein